MKGTRKLLLKAISTVMAAAFLSVSILSTSASAAAPVVTVKTGQGNGAKTVSNLRVINLEQPKAGVALDTVADIMTDEGFFWEVPVVWIDENGAIAKAFVPGKKLVPVITFFIPSDVTVAKNSAGGFTIKLPEFLDGQFNSSNLLVVEDPSNNITLITTTEIADTLSAMSVVSSGNNAEQINRQKANGAYNYASYAAANSSWATVPASSNENSSSGSDENNVAPQPQPQPQPEPQPVEPDPNVLMYCSQSAVEHLGYDNMAMLYNLVTDTILPQVVSVMTESIPAFRLSDNGKAIGERIGLLVYTSDFPDSRASEQTSIAYVVGVPLGTETYVYMMGVNAKTLFTQDPETGTYVYNENERANLENTVTHEMLHAFMDDYTRAGVVRMPDQSNDYPGWFCEGIASAVENVYTFRYDQYSKIYGYSQANDGKGGTLEATTDDVLEFYKTYSEIYPAGTDINHVPDIGTSDDAGNRISAYSMGYLATVYLSYLSQAQTSGTDPLNYESFTSEQLRDGLGTIFLRLHEGETLDEVISDISGGMYANTDDFTAKFVKGENLDGTNGQGEAVTAEASLDFCTSYLNYLGAVTTELKKTDPNATANGSILLPLDTAAKSPIQPEAPEGAKENQEYFNIYHDDSVPEEMQPYVYSTVDPALALQSGGKTQKVPLDGAGQEQGEAVEERKVDNEPGVAAPIEEVETDPKAAAEDDPKASVPAEEAAPVVEPAQIEEPASAVEPDPVKEPEPAIEESKDTSEEAKTE